MLLRFQRLTPACWTEGLEAAIARSGARGVSMPCLREQEFDASSRRAKGCPHGTIVVEVHMDGELRCRM
jgi:hypothetical protein